MGCGCISTGASMDLQESGSQSFIIKIWLEETTAEAGQARWRGHITHVPSGKRRYIQDLAAIPLFIAPYLREMGVSMSFGRRVRRWLRLRKP
jgi:starvation-inducible outer membrane lipoprotein